MIPFLAALSIVPLFAAVSNTGLHVIDTIRVGQGPTAVAVNPLTDRIYVTGDGPGNNVTIIDGKTDGTLRVHDPNARGPFALAVDTQTDKIYVVNNRSANVSVIDGLTNQLQTITDPNAAAPVAIAVDERTDKIYVANDATANVTVIDGSTNKVTDVADPNAAGPSAVAVNPVTDKIYVGNTITDNLTVIDGATNATTTVGPFAQFSDPQSVDVDPRTNVAYVLARDTNQMEVVDGVTNAFTTIDGIGPTPNALDIDNFDDRIYIADAGNGTVIDYNGNTGRMKTFYTSGAFAVAVDQKRDFIYVLDSNTARNNLNVIDGRTGQVTTLHLPGAKWPYALAVNPVTNRIYVANVQSNNVSVIAGPVR